MDICGSCEFSNGGKTCKGCAKRYAPMFGLCEYKYHSPECYKNCMRRE